MKNTLLSFILLTALTACQHAQLPSVVINAKQSTIGLELIARHSGNQYGEGAAEVVVFDQKRERLLVVNGAANAVDMININKLPQQPLAVPYSTSNLDSQRLILPNSVLLSNGNKMPLKSPNSIDVHDDWLAVAMQNENKQANGAVLFYSLNASIPKLIKSVEVGSLPDMLKFTEDGKKLVVANEGEPSKNYKNDPEGSVSIINMQPLPADKAIELTFDSFNNQRTQLQTTGVKFASPVGTSVAQDLEPEYIAISKDSQTAYVTLQENNALAIVDLTQASIELVVGLGYKDWGQYKLDVSDKDGSQINSYPGLFSLYQPDSISSYQVDGKNYLVTANEGDARNYRYSSNEKDCNKAGHQYQENNSCISYSEQSRVSKLTLEPSSMLKSSYSEDGLGRLKVSTVLGDLEDNGVYEKLFAFGGRSFSIWDQKGTLLFDSGDQFSQQLLAKQPQYFNLDENSHENDKRSDDKGSEPEALALAEINSKHYAFIGLERQGGIFIYDITNPRQASYVNYIDNRNKKLKFKIDDEQSPILLQGSYQDVGDLAPESILFINDKNSPSGEPLLITANEVSGSVTIYRVIIQ